MSDSDARVKADPDAPIKAEVTAPVKAEASASSPPATAAAAAQRVIDGFTRIIYWSDPLLSGLAFAVGIAAFFLVGILGYSSLSLLAYTALGHIVARLVYANARAALAEMNIVPKRKPPAAPASFVTEEELASMVPAATAAANAGLAAAFRLLVGESRLFHGEFNPEVFKWIGGLYALALAARLLGTTGVLFLFFVSLFTLPKLYQHKRKEIDQAYDRAKKEAGRIAREVLKYVNAALKPARAPPKAKAI